jgi:hypothetical protein
VLRASYEDFIVGRAEAAQISGPFDLVQLGFCSFSNLTEPGEHLALLERCHRVAPLAPVLLSFFVREGNGIARGGADRLRGFLRASFRRLGAQPFAEGLEFHETSGFTYTFSEDEFRDCARRAGYRVARLVEDFCDGALLVPE